jgi:hypothetical protein
LYRIFRRERNHIRILTSSTLQLLRTSGADLAGLSGHSRDNGKRSIHKPGNAPVRSAMHAPALNSCAASCAYGRSVLYRALIASGALWCVAGISADAGERK